MFKFTASKYPDQGWSPNLSEVKEGFPLPGLKVSTGTQ